MESIFANLNSENEALRAYFFYSSLLILKVLSLAAVTTFKRIKHRAFCSPEDGAVFNSKPRLDENVERIRRAHLNDLENIPFFLVVALIYLLTGPPQHLAINLFRIYAVARISHTLVYTVFIMPQPTRALAYGVGWVVKAYMAFQSLLYFL